MSHQVGFLKLNRMDGAIYPHLNGEITVKGFKEIRRAYADLKKSGTPYCIVVPVPKGARHIPQSFKIEQMCKMFGLRYWYQTPHARVYGDYREPSAEAMAKDLEILCDPGR